MPAYPTFAVVCAAAAAALCLSAACAADQPASPPEPANPLAGPRVAEKKAEVRTLVERDMAGKLVRLERRPEALAVGLLGLAGAEREKADAALAERAKVVSRVLWANLNDFLAVQGALQAGDRATAASLIMKLRPALSDLLDPPLVDRVAGALPAEKQGAYRDMVAEYTRALAEEEPGPAGDAASGPARSRPLVPPARRVEMNLTLRELARSLGDTVNERKERTEEIVRLSEATPEQAEAIRAAARTVAERALAEGRAQYTPSPEQRAELMRKIAAVLTAEQRGKLVEGLRARGG